MNTLGSDLRPGPVNLTRADFETVLDGLESDATEQQREDAQDVLQGRAPSRWLQELEDVENERRRVWRRI